MKSMILGLGALALALSVPAVGLADTTIDAVALTACGGMSYASGAVRPLTQDLKGQHCVSGTTAVTGNVKTIGPTANGSAAATAPVLVGGTADGTATGNVGNLKVDSSGNAATNMAQIAGAAPSLTNPLWIANASVTPAAGAASSIASGTVANALVTGPVKGCIITNPLTATDEGIAAIEPLYVNPVTTATTASNTTTFALAPGQSFNCVAGQTTSVSGNATTTGHKATVVTW